jgi:arylsulfatase A-like enzyme
VPRHIQGRVFIGENRSQPRETIFAARDRCDETVDRIRCVRDRRWKYIRNFMPDRPYTQPNKYKEGSYPALGIMKEMYAQGKLNEEQAHFFKPTRPAEELHDLQNDPDEVRDLSGQPQHRDVLLHMRALLDKWIVETKDQGEKPET